MIVSGQQGHVFFEAGVCPGASSTFALALTHPAWLASTSHSYSHIYIQALALSAMCSICNLNKQLASWATLTVAAQMSKTLNASQLRCHTLTLQSTDGSIPNYI
jgi:hypothetical protein